MNDIIDENDYLPWKQYCAFNFLEEEIKKLLKLIRKINKLSNLDEMQSSGDMQNALEEINKLTTKTVKNNESLGRKRKIV